MTPLDFYYVIGFLWRHKISMTSLDFYDVIISYLIGRGWWPMSGSNDEDERVIADEGDEQEDNDSEQDSGLAKDKRYSWEEISIKSGLQY